MSDIIAKAEGGGHKDFDPIPAGVHVAVCYGLFDIGTQKKEWKGEVKFQRQVIICWELPDERIDIEKDGKAQNLPRAISNHYTLSLGEKANLRRDLENWRGKPFTDTELSGFSLKNILGKACQLQVVHKPKRDGGVWANISAVMALPKGVKPPEAENPLKLWAIGDDEEGVPPWILRKAHESEELKDAPDTQEDHESTTVEDTGVPF